MATCSDGDSFYLDTDYTGDGFLTYSGCYSEIGITYNYLPQFFRGGDRVDGETLVFATDSFGFTETWALAYYVEAEDFYYFACKDADEVDATLIHPTEVIQWDCVDDDVDFTIFDAVTTACSCPTPSPTWALTSAPTAPEPTPAPLTPTTAPSTPTTDSPTLSPINPASCGATESFRITSAGLPEVEGCFQATEASFSNPGSTLEVWSVTGNTNYDQVVVAGSADDSTGESSDSPYYLAYVAEVEDDTISYCQSKEDAITVHPVDATWECDLSSSGLFVDVTDADIFFDCGCVPTPTPGPVVVPEPTSSPTSSSSVPLGAVIGGSVGGAAFLAIVGVLVARRHRGNNRIENPANAPPAARNYPATSDGGGAATTAVAGGRGGPVQPLPPPIYSGNPHTVDVAPASSNLPPPPAYSEPPAYSG